MREEIAVALEDVEFVCGGFFVVASEGPGACGAGGVFRCEF